MYKIAVLVSGSGSNLQAIINNIENGDLNCKIECVISDKPGALAIDRAKKKGIDAYVIDKREYKDELSDRILTLIDGKVDLIVLAGFLSILKGKIIKKFKNRVINIHPSLIPSFMGNGMYGSKVHKAAIEYGVKVTGCTVHIVDEGTDTGPIIIQKTVPVMENDDEMSLQKRVLEEEHKALSEVISLFINNKIKIEERKVFII
ncbi:phosphoribosylglycinamide formyltransferase [uncultured Clostridium sp.]|uniref:phosphoribosylglycinamide formyltransferase n=1 Tax=uncultured Clostridium sp. TaxID=59620 RepID=UPI0028EE7581|nr:phosphoribosylglycinamide formyltransferase [uncultured Clostridium sp.]